MPLESGGRADKFGNKYEMRCIVYALLEVYEEKYYSCTIEALGEDEKMTDILLVKPDGTNLHIQCKARNASSESWDICDLKNRNILSGWKYQLDRGDEHVVAMISPCGCSDLKDLRDRALNTSDDPSHFLGQINSSSIKFKNSYKHFCEGMQISNQIDGANQAKNYLKRIQFIQKDEDDLLETNRKTIGYLFNGDIDSILSKLHSFIIEGNILGKEITKQYLMEYFANNDIVSNYIDKKMVGDRLASLKNSYISKFKSIKDNWIERPIFNKCIKSIQRQKSLCIVGKAGYGKTGCTISIIKYCDLNEIPVLPIKLDEYFPKKNLDEWSYDLGFSKNIVSCIHEFSLSTNAVIILDQFDVVSIRNNDTNKTMRILDDLIENVKRANETRDKKIVVVFVCRNYDYEYNTFIKNFFSNKCFEYEKIEVDKLEESVVREYVGECYDDMHPSLKMLLSTPSNLYVWSQLDCKSFSNYVNSTYSLISEWFKLIRERAELRNISDSEIREVIDEFVSELKIGDSSYIKYQQVTQLDCDLKAINFLISSNFLILENDSIGFVHQTIFDYFVSMEMIRKYKKKEATIEDIIGSKSEQTLTRRYQVQMFLDTLYQENMRLFIQACQEIIESSNIREYIKHTVYSMLAQIDDYGPNEMEFIIKICNNDKYVGRFIEYTIKRNKELIIALIQEGLFEKWFHDVNKKEQVFNILESLGENKDKAIIDFINRLAFKNIEDDRKLFKLISYDPFQEIEESFELRVKFYDKYPEWMENSLFNFTNENLTNYPIRTVCILKKSLNAKKIIDKNNIQIDFDENLPNCFNQMNVETCELILEELLPLIPTNNKQKVKDFKFCYPSDARKLQRACVEIVKNASVMLAKNQSQLFFDKYSQYFGKDYPIFNEIIMTSLAYVPSKESDRVINYITENFDIVIFDKTSKEVNELELLKKNILKHAEYCNTENFVALENKIYSYKEEETINNFCKEYPKIGEKNNFEHVIYWGNVQYFLLPCLPSNRTSKNTKQLIGVLNRRQSIRKHRLFLKPTIFDSMMYEIPLAGKKLSKKSWAKIISNNKISSVNRRLNNRNDGIDYSLDGFARAFGLAVRDNPVEMIEVILENKDVAPLEYVNSLFYNLSNLPNLNEVDIDLLERLFSEFPIKGNYMMMVGFAEIISKLDNAQWNTQTIQQLKEMSLYFQDCDYKSNVSYAEGEINSSKLATVAINSAPYYTGKAIRNLILNDPERYLEFKDIVDEMYNDTHQEVKYASILPLSAILQVDEKWAAHRLLDLSENDLRMNGLCFQPSILFKLYSNDPERIDRAISQCLFSSDEELKEFAVHTVFNLYLVKNEYEDFIFSENNFDTKQIDWLINDSISVLRDEQYKEKAMKIIRFYKSRDKDNSIHISKIFSKDFVDVHQDKEFIEEIMQNSINWIDIDELTDYLDRKNINLIDYFDLILYLGDSLLQRTRTELHTEWNLIGNIIGLSIKLFDQILKTQDYTQYEKEKMQNSCMDLWDKLFDNCMALDGNFDQCAFSLNY